jgi:hypothetical protein
MPVMENNALSLRDLVLREAFHSCTEKQSAGELLCNFGIAHAAARQVRLSLAMFNGQPCTAAFPGGSANLVRRFRSMGPIPSHHLAYSKASPSLAAPQISSTPHLQPRRQISPSHDLGCRWQDLRLSRNGYFRPLSETSSSLAGSSPPIEVSNVPRPHNQKQR